MVAENEFRQMLRTHAKVVRAGPHGAFEYTLQAPHGAFFSGQIMDGGEDGVPGQGQRGSNHTFTLNILAGTPVATDFTSIASFRTPNPAIVAVCAGGNQTQGAIAHWEAQTVDPSSDTIVIPGVCDMKFTVDGSVLTIVARNLYPRESGDPVYVDYSIRALYFNCLGDVDLELVSVSSDASYPYTFPAPADVTQYWNLIQAL